MEINDIVQATMTELNMDDDELQIITNYVNEAIPFVIQAVDSSKTFDDFKDNLLFCMVVKTIAKQAYYEATFPDGFSKGAFAIIKQLQAQADAGSESNGTDKV